MKKQIFSLSVILLLLPVFLTASQRVTVDRSKYNAISVLDQLNRSYNFIVHTIVSLPNGKERFKQFETYKDIMVWDTHLVSQKKNFKNLKIDDLTAGTFLTNIEDDISSIKPKLTKPEALKIVHDCPNNHTDGDKTTEPGDVQNVKVELIIKEFGGTTAKLVYMVNYMVEEPAPSRPYYVIDANTGALLEKWEGLPSFNKDEMFE